MTKSMKLRGLTVAALAATALFAAQPAAADVIQINSYWAGAGFDHISYSEDNGATYLVNENAGTGGFSTSNLTTGNTFQSFCVDIFHSFNWGAQSESTLQPATIISAQAATDLGKLYTNHHNLIDLHNSTGGNEGAFQLAVWEIVNEA